MTERGWAIRLTAAAERDFANILAWTAETFGARQAATYRSRLLKALSPLEKGPNVAGSRPRDDISQNLRAFHVGRPGRHFVVFR